MPEQGVLYPCLEAACGVIAVLGRGTRCPCGSAPRAAETGFRRGFVVVRRRRAGAGWILICATGRPSPAAVAVRVAAPVCGRRARAPQRPHEASAAAGRCACTPRRAELAASLGTSQNADAATPTPIAAAKDLSLAAWTARWSVLWNAAGTVERCRTERGGTRSQALPAGAVRLDGVSRHISLARTTSRAETGDAQAGLARLARLPVVRCPRPLAQLRASRGFAGPAAPARRSPRAAPESV